MITLYADTRLKRAHTLNSSIGKTKKTDEYENPKFCTDLWCKRFSYYIGIEFIRFFGLFMANKIWYEIKNNLRTAFGWQLKKTIFPDIQKIILAAAKNSHEYTFQIKFLCTKVLATFTYIYIYIYMLHTTNWWHWIYCLTLKRKFHPLAPFQPNITNFFFFRL